MLSSEVPEGYEFDFQEYLFNTAIHRLTQAAEGWKSYYWLDEKKKRVKASFHAHIVNDQAKSPYRATFGGIDFYEELSLKLLSEFVGKIKRSLVNGNIKSLKITTPPQNYNPSKFTILFQALADNGFQLTTSEASAVLKIGHGSFEELIHKSERKKLNRATGSGYKFMVESKRNYSDIYLFIQKCRNERGHKLSLTQDQLEKIIDVMPTKFSYFSVYDDKNLIASAICINVSSEILYVFYGGHLSAYDKSSPAVFLYHGIFEWCRVNGFKMIDFGSSSTASGTNLDLLDFKLYLGAELGLKVTFEHSFHG